MAEENQKFLLNIRRIQGALQSCSEWLSKFEYNVMASLSMVNEIQSATYDLQEQLLQECAEPDIPIEFTKTDLSKFVELYKSVGIDVNYFKNELGYFIRIEQGQPGFTGLLSHHCKIIFDTKGRFVEQKFLD